MVVYDSEGNGTDVPDETGVRLVQAGTHTLAPGTSVVARNETGGPTTLNGRQVNDLSQTSPFSAEEEAASLRKNRLEEEHDTAGSRAKAFLGGGANMLSLGFANPFKEDQEFHSGYAVGGKIAGVLPTLLIPGAGEENAARGVAELGASALAEERAAGGLMSSIRGSRAGRAVGEFAAETPLGYATRLGSAAGKYVGERVGGGVLGRVAGTTAEGAVGGGVMGFGNELSRQTLEDDAHFSAENLLGSTLEGAALGGAVGLGGSLVSEGVGALSHVPKARPTGLTSEEFVARAKGSVPKEFDPAVTGVDRPPLSDLIGPNASRHVTTMDGLAGRARDLNRGLDVVRDLTENPVLMKQAGLTKDFLQETAGSISRELNGIRSFGKYGDATLERIANDAHLNDLAMTRLGPTTERIPGRWTDPQLLAQATEARDAALSSLSKRRAMGAPVSQAEEDAARYAAQLGVGKTAAEKEAIRDGLVARAAKGLIGKLPGGKYLAMLGSGAAGVGIAGALAEHGALSLLGHAAVPAAGAVVAAKIVRAAFKDPHIGGLLAANTSAVLNGTSVLRDTRPGASRDPRRALRELADRARSVTPGQVNASTVTSLGHLAATSPSTVAMAGKVAAERHAQLLSTLDRLDPRATTAGAMLERPLPSSSAAHEAADLIRMAAGPTNFLVAAMDGRLTPQMMGSAERLWPATVQRVRAELLSGLSSADVSEIPPSRRRSIEMILGPSALGGPPSSDVYTRAMTDSVARQAPPTTQAGASPSPQPMGPIADSPLATPTIRAANPATK